MSGVDFGDLLASSRLARLRPLLESKEVDIDRFCSAYIRTSPAGAAAAGAAGLSPLQREAHLLLIRRLIELFARIDNLSQGTITWEQFTTYAAEASLASAGTAPGAAQAPLTTGKVAPIVYRESSMLRAPPNDELPATGVTAFRWVAELQQLFVTFEESPTCFVFNHLGRLIARLHANLPPEGAAAAGAHASVSQMAKEEMAEKFRSRVSLREALNVGAVEAEVLGPGDVPRDIGESGAGDLLGGGDSSWDDAPTVDGDEGVGSAAGGANSTADGEDANPDVAWAKRVLRQRVTLSVGERMKAAHILANVRCVAEARKAALLSELGAGVTKHGMKLSLKQQIEVDADKKKATYAARLKSFAAGGASADPTNSSSMRNRSAEAELVAMRTRQARLNEAVELAVGERAQAMAARRGYAIERATSKQVLLAHPAGFSILQAERLLKSKVKDLGDGASAILPVLGVKSSSAMRWSKASSALTTGGAASGSGGTAAEKSLRMQNDASRAAAGLGTEASEGQSVAEATGGGKPQVAASAAMVAFDPGPAGKQRDFGYLVETVPRFLSDKDKKSRPGALSGAAAAGSAVGGKAKGSGEVSTTAAQTRLEALAMPRGSRAQVTLLAVEYCMPVSRELASDVKKWRAISPADVRHLIAVSSSELVITLWSSRSFDYSGVIHTLLPQNLLLWSTGANVLVTCNTYVGPISCWDVLSGTKIVQLHGHTQAVQALVDVASLGYFCSGALDGEIHVWGYRPDGEHSGDAGGLRGRAAPRKPFSVTVLQGHTSGVTHAVVVEDASGSNSTRLVSVALGAELCIWDLSHFMLMACVSGGGSSGGGGGREHSGVTALCITNSKPPRALTVDGENLLRMWTLDSEGAGAGSGIAECIDTYRIEGVPFGGVSALVMPAPHAHVIVGGRKLVLLAPGASDSDSGGGGSSGYLVPVAARYSEDLTCFVLAEGLGVTVFDARTGLRLRRFEKLMPQVVVSLALDGSGRRGAVGDAGGDIFCFNVLDGLVVGHAVPSHSDDVTAIISVPEDSLIYTCSWDRSLRAYDIASHAGAASSSILPCIRVVQNAHPADITCMAVSRQLGLVATGSADGSLRVWDMCSFELAAQLMGHAHGVTQVTFPGPACVPLLFSADEGGHIFAWAVRGSLYTDRLMIGLVNTGRPSGPPPPSLKVVDLAQLKTVEARSRVGVMKDGALTMQTFGHEEAKNADAGLESLFSKRKAKITHERKLTTLADTLKHQVSQARGLADTLKYQASPDRGLASSLSPLATPRPHKGEDDDDDGGVEPFSPSPQRRAHEPEPEDNVAVPVSALAVFAFAASLEEIAEMGGKIDCATPLVMKIFTGDGQGMVKQWDVSAIVNRFARGGVTGIGIMPATAFVSSSISFNPHQSRQKIYPDEQPAAFDPEVAAAKAMAEQQARRISSMGRKQRVIVSVETELSVALLARLKMQRTLYHTARVPVKAVARESGGLDIRGLSLDQLEAIAIDEAKARGEDVSAAPGAEPVIDAADLSPLSKNRPASAASRLSAGAASSSPDVHFDGGRGGKVRLAPSYPKALPFVEGSIIYAKITEKSKPSPLLPVFMVPIVAAAGRIKGGSSEVQSLEARASAASAAAKAILAAGAGSNASSGSSGGVAVSGSGNGLIYETLADVPREVQDDLWHSFDSSRPEFVRARHSIVALVEQEARRKGWEFEKDAEFGSRSRRNSALSVGVSSRPGSSKARSSHPAPSMVITVPPASWTASRMRRDVRPQAVWTAHTDAVSSIVCLHNPHALVTTSLDGSTRMWTFNGLPMAVVNAAPRNIELERAMAAAAAVGGDTDGIKDVKNLTKEDTPWQYVPDDEGKIARTTLTATRILTRLTTVKPHGQQRRASIMLTAAPTLQHMRVDELAAKSKTIDQALSTVYQMGRRASREMAELEVKQNAFLLAAQGATVAAEAMAINRERAGEEEDEARGVFHSKKMRGVTLEVSQAHAAVAAAPLADAVGEAVGELDEAATMAIDKALISAIENWDAHTDMRRGSQQGKAGSGRTQPQLPVSPARQAEVDAAAAAAAAAPVEPQGRQGARRLSDVTTLRMYPHLAHETSTVLARRKEMEETFLASIGRPGSASAPATVEPVEGRVASARPTSAASRRTTTTLRRGSAAPSPPRIASTVMLRGVGEAGELDAGMRSAQEFVRTRPQSAAADLPAGHVIGGSGTAPAAIGGRSGAARPQSAMPALHSSLPPAPPSRPGSASLVTPLRVSAAAAGAGGSLDALLGVKPLFPEVSAGSTSGTVTRASDGVGPGAIAAGAESKADGGSADFPRSPADQLRVLGTVERAQLLLQAAESSAMHLTHRRRAVDLLGEAKAAQAARLRAEQGLPPLQDDNVAALSPPRPLRPASASAALGARRSASPTHSEGGAVPALGLTRAARPSSAASAPAQGFAAAKTFGAYTVEAVDKFRATWALLDKDRSGAVDVEELLNAKVFASSAMKTTKAIFATIDADRSGDVSLYELVKVVFPHGPPEIRRAIIRYMQFKAREELEEKERRAASPVSQRAAVLAAAAAAKAAAAAPPQPPPPTKRGGHGADSGALQIAEAGRAARLQRALGGSAELAKVPESGDE